MRSMNIPLKRKLVAAVVIGVAAAGAGGAIAASQLGSPREENQAILNDAARQLGVEPSALSNALKQALKNRVDAAVAAGRLTQEEGNELKERIDSDEFPFFFGLHHGPGHFAHLADLDAAASYLGLSRTELRDQLFSGKSLAQIARDQDKSVDGLVQALLDSAKERLDDAVDEGRLTAAQRDQILSDLKERFTQLVNRTFEPRRPFGFGFRRAVWDGEDM
jgi:polyhydroxyalkanoate synthesis regulator phasin